MLTEKDLDLISHLLITSQYNWHIYLILIILLCLSSFFGAYLAQMAKNKANNENFISASKWLCWLQLRQQLLKP
jgi:hypothetical protein